MPPKNWTPRTETGLTMEQVFSHNEVEWVAAGDRVRYNPTPVSDKPRWVKVSKSD